MGLVPAVLFSALALPALAQATYTYTGASDNNNGSRWNVTANWDQPSAPGSLLNGTAAVDDNVIIRNNEGNGSSQRIRLQADPGTIGSLEIGGIGAAGSTGATQLQLRSSVSLDVSGDLTLGSTFGGGQRAGQINFSNGNTSLSVGGNVISGSTSGANNINVNQGNNSAFTLTGDIDSAAARGGASDQEIDLIISRDEGLILNGVGAQELNLESLYIINTGANVGTITQTIGGDKVVNALNGRIGSVTNNNRAATGTLAVDGGVITYTGALVVGRTQNQNNGNNDNADATGNLNVGGANAGTVTVGGQLTLGEQLAGTGGNAQVATGNITVADAGSVLNINSGLNMGATVQAGGTTAASLTINGGQVNLSGAITEDAAQAGNSTITLNGGELALLDAGGGTRNVDTLSHTGTGVMNFSVYGGMPTLATSDIALSASAGGSIFDVTTAPAGTTFSTTVQNTWNGGGTGATPDGEWVAGVAGGADWSSGIAPDASFGAISPGENFVLLSSTNAVTGDAAAAALTAGASGAGWAISQNSNDVTLTAASAIGGGTGAAHFNNGAADVTRASDLNIEAAAGTGADATQIDIDDLNSLSLTGGSSLILGGSAQGVVNQGSVGGAATGNMAVTVGGDLVFGGGGLQGGTYNINEGSLAVTGQVVEGQAGAPNASVNNAQLQVNTGAIGAQALTAAGGVTVQRFSVAQADGSTAGLEISNAAGLPSVTTTGTFAVGTGSNASRDGVPGVVSGAVGTVVVDGGTVNVLNANIAENGDSQGSLTLRNNANFTSVGRVYVAGGQTNGNDSETIGSVGVESGSVLTVNTGNLEVGRGGVGSLVVDNATYNQLANNLVLGQSGGTHLAEGTATFRNGADINMGDAANGALNTDLNINNSGGTVLQQGATTNVFIERNLNMGGGNNPSSYTLEDGILFVGQDIAARAGDGQDTFKNQDGEVTVARNVNMTGGTLNTLTITGSNGSFNVGNDLILNGTSTVEFALDAGGVSPILVAEELITGDGAGNDATLLLDFAAFEGAGNTPIVFGDIDLIIAADTTVDAGAGDPALALAQEIWGNVAYGTTVYTSPIDGTTYELHERLGSLTVYLAAVPEPSSAMLLAFGCSFFFLRRRRAS
ncbi:MAG: PEP-CTERM sorting domain-containing protein [Roseibacillus sp.]